METKKLISGCMEMRKEWVGRRDYQEHQETFRAVGYAHYLNFGDSFMEVRILKLFKLCTPTMWSLYVKYTFQFSSVESLSHVRLCDPMNHSSPGLPVHHQLPESTQTHVHQVGDAIQPSHPLPSPSPPALNPSQNQGLFQWVNSSHEVAKVLGFQLQHQSFQWTPRTDLP